MAQLTRLKPGQTLFTITRQKMGNTQITRNAIHPVYVLEVHPEEGYVLASWNGNPAKRFRAAHVLRWKVKKPESPALFAAAR